MGRDEKAIVAGCCVVFSILMFLTIPGYGRYISAAGGLIAAISIAIFDENKFRGIGLLIALGLIIAGNIVSALQ